MFNFMKGNLKHLYQSKKNWSFQLFREMKKMRKLLEQTIPYTMDTLVIYFSIVQENKLTENFHSLDLPNT